MKALFNPRSVAIVGVSSNPEKIGATILLNLMKNGFSGNLYPVNPKYDEVYGLKCYKSVKEIPNVDVIVIAVPAESVVDVIKEGKDKAKYFIIISGGFGEAGNEKVTKELKEVGKNLKIVGPNCLGVYSSKSLFDTIFFPYSRLERPKKGKIAIISQSGGVGSVLLSLAARYNIGINSFVSYGNAYFLNENDFLEFFAKDKETKAIILYIEGTSDGKRFVKTLKKFAKKKPVIVLKAGKEGKAKEAAKTHTGNVAGDYLSYKAVFKKSGAIEVENFEEMFDVSKAFLNTELPRGKNIGIISNGGGLAVMASDEAVKLGLNIPDLSQKTKEFLRKEMPSYVTVANPLDVVADATVERYEKALKAFMEDENIDMVCVNILIQPPTINNSIIQKIASNIKKPTVVCVPGGNIEQEVRKAMLTSGIACYAYPENAIKSLHKLYEYAKSIGVAKR
jgi:acyl-CoA synthetase (NDP forming)